jgi:hypothetical protein
MATYFEILDKSDDIIAKGFAEPNADSTLCGELSENRFTGKLLELLRELEEAVDEQSFPAADKIEEKIAEFGLRVRFTDGIVAPINSLYLNKDNGISYKIG